MPVSLEIKGLQETQQDMERIVRELEGEGLIKGMKTATLRVERSAKINATTFPKVVTGRLRASIVPSVEKIDHSIQGVVGSNVEYAPFQELGTVYIAPRKYLERAFQDNLEDIVNDIGQAVSAIIRS